MSLVQDGVTGVALLLQSFTPWNILRRQLPACGAVDGRQGRLRKGHQVTKSILACPAGIHPRSGGAQWSSVEAAGSCWRGCCYLAQSASSLKVKALLAQTNCIRLDLR